MDNISVADQNSSASETSEQYEQNEVVWAKIQGYPWWPAFIGEIQESQEEGTTYKVYFFGDNSHSRLHSQKIRKFQDFFSNFSVLAKKNYRLKQALAIAEQQLIENKEDVSYFIPHSQEKKKSEQKSPSNHQDLAASNSKKQMQVEEHISQPVAEIQARRRRGRPKTQNIIKLIGVENGVAKIQMIQHQLEEAQSTLANHQTPQKSQNQQIKQVLQTYQPSDKKNVSESKSTKKGNKQIERVKHLIEKSFYKQALNLLLHYQINFENVMEVLESQIIRKLEEKIKIRSLFRLKDKIKKILLDKYFKSKHFAPIFQYRGKDTIRAKAIRKLSTLLSKNHGWAEAKQIALKLQQAIQSKSNRDNSNYMKNMTALIKTIKEDFSEDQIKEFTIPL